MARKRASQASENAVANFFGLDDTDDEEVQSKPKSKPKKVTVPVYMPAVARDKYQRLADQYEGMSRSRAMEYALLYFLEEYEAGRAVIEFRQKRVPVMPGNE